MVSFLFKCERIKIRLFVRCGRGHRSLSDARGRGRLFFKISKLYFQREVTLYNTEGAEMRLKPLYWSILSGLGLKSRGNSFFSILKLLLPRKNVTGLSFYTK